MELFERHGDFDGVTRVIPLRRTADAPVRPVPQREEAAPFGKDVLPRPENPIRIDDEFEIEVLISSRAHEELQRVSLIDLLCRLPEGVDLLIRKTHGDTEMAVAPARQPQGGAGLPRLFVTVHDKLPFETQGVAPLRRFRCTVDSGRGGEPGQARGWNRVLPGEAQFRLASNPCKRLHRFGIEIFPPENRSIGIVLAALVGDEFRRSSLAAIVEGAAGHDFPGRRLLCRRVFGCAAAGQQRQQCEKQEEPSHRHNTSTLLPAGARKLRNS